MERHPRFIVEGACGVGKSTLARALANEVGAPVYRPFRGTNDHIPDFVVRQMQDLGISVNGWEEDLYTADLMANVPFPVVIDRSMPSAMAWDAVRSEPLEPRNRRAILRLWAERIVAARAILVLVACDAQTRLKRCPDRGGDWEVEGIRAAIREAWNEAPGLVVWTVRTDFLLPEVIALDLNKKYRFGKSVPSVFTMSAGDA
jgi:hypothetical protein